ncbi:MAG: hypothetical protein IJ242_15965 [Clostridia bacterium]|nr:hypothetical protein [Clostridia bacterium]
MTLLEEQTLRFCLNYEIVKDLPGYLRIRFPAYHRLPEAALPYMGYVNDALTLIPGIDSASPNPRIGTLLIRYRANVLDTAAISNWIRILTDEGIRFYREYEGKMPGEQEIVSVLRKRLIDKVAQVMMR